MDDSIIFARHLCKLSVEHHLTVVHNLTHGFLNFYNANNECKKVTDRIISDLAQRYYINGSLFSSRQKKKQNRKKKEQ